MASPPVVANLSDLIGQYTTAQAPQQAALDDESQQNDQSGTAQVAGLNSAKDAAFGGITQNASNRGEYFSGFTPDAEAKYTGSTYLPALAKVQSAIAGVRDTILGKKADLTTQANSSALAEQKSEQSALDAYNQEQEKEAAAAALQAQSDAAALQRANVSSGPSASQSAAAQQKADFATVVGNLNGVKGKDGYVAPKDYNQALSDWLSAGYSSASFKTNFGSYANPNQANLYGNNGVNPYKA